MTCRSGTCSTARRFGARPTVIGRHIYVFSSDAGYIVVAPRSRNNFSITLVKSDSPQVISRKFKGKRITVKDLKSLFGEYFDRLNALYVMVALGRAKKLKEKMGRAMLFKVK